MSKSNSLLKAGVLFLLSMSAITGWHRMNDRPSSLDETKHMQLAMDYRDWLAHDVPLQNPWDHVYPPVYHFSIIPAMSVGVPTEAKAVLTHSLYILFFIVGCLLLGRAQQRSDDESLVAALLTLGYTYVLWASRRALTDFPMLAWVTFSMGLLARTRGFGLREESLWWGVSAAVGLLIKFTFGFFFVLPVMVILLGGRDKGRIKNALLALGVAALLGGSWYFWNSAFFLDKASGLVNEVTVSQGDPRTLAGWLFYIKTWPEQMGGPNTIFTALGLLFALFFRFGERGEGDGFFWLWFISGYLILSAMMNKDMRHTLPMLPAVAFLAVRGWDAVFPVTWGPRALWPIAAMLFGWTVTTYDLPAKEKWPHVEIGQLLARTHDRTQPFLAASVLSHHPRFFARGLKWSLRAQGLSLKATGAGNPDSGFVEYILLKKSYDGTGSADIEAEWRGAQPQSRAFQTLFHVIGEFPFPNDQGKVFIYQRDPRPRFDVSPLTSEAVAARLAHTFQRWAQGPLRVTVEATPEGLRSGHLDKITASCKECQVEGVTVPSAEVVLNKPWINLYNLWDMDRIGLLAFESVGAKLRLSAQAVAAPLSKVRDLKDARVEFSGGKIKVRARFHGIPVQAVARAEIIQGSHPHALATLETIRVCGIPLPGWILGKASRQTLWLEPQPSFPGRVLLTRITLENNELILE